VSWTYTGNPASSTLDAVRFEIGDTLSTDPELSDEEITWVITQESNLKYAAAAACDRVAARYARKVEKSVGQLKLSMQQKFDQYLKLASRLRAQGGSAPIPFAGGISVADKRTRQLDLDREQTTFGVDTEEMLPNDSEHTIIPTPGDWQ
jgi:hypothetical protein